MKDVNRQDFNFGTMSPGYKAGAAKAFGSPLAAQRFFDRYKKTVPQSRGAYVGKSYQMNKPRGPMTAEDQEWEAYWNEYRQNAVDEHRKKGVGNLYLDPEAIRKAWSDSREAQGVSATPQYSNNRQTSGYRKGSPTKHFKRGLDGSLTPHTITGMPANGWGSLPGMNTGQNRYRSR